MILLGGLGLVAAFAIYVRLAPSDPARWNISLPMDAPDDCMVRPARGSASVSCLIAEDPTVLLRQLEGIVLATPRTTRLAGSPEEGRITWITRSRLWGFPDYTTVQVSQTCTGTRIDIFARLRFGGDDMGVNAGRLSVWFARLTAE
ncbi:DUF1499 domain-containing protein [Gemmobacter straminiformis]|uniref:DUF1499 domain-containing protein n=2 Tax=Paragemmobacter straminiformis TaxID=2045119 RepID=A0A842I6Z1_9RHOB|nr:DUF1499 domain-containing protein [Gemmobacter straminiformis]